MENIYSSNSQREGAGAKYTDEKILISVVIPSYNRADTVGITIDSIMAQKVNADIEIVIGDDCSTDNARDILLEYKAHYKDNIRLFFREENVGLGANWAQCVKDCRGKYICNCDNDDYWHNPNKLQLQLDYMESHPNSNVLITDHRRHNRSTGVITEEKCQFDSNSNLQDAMWGGCMFCNATIMYRADFIKTHLDLDEFIRRRLSLQDWPVWVILAAYTNFDVLPVSTATFGVETVSITRPNSIEHFARRLEKDREVYQYLGELFPEKFPFNEEEWVLYSNGRLCSLAFKLGQYENAKTYGRKCSGISVMKRFCSQHKWAFDLFLLSKNTIKIFKG